LLQIFTKLLSAKRIAGCKDCQDAKLRSIEGKQQKYTLFNAAVDTLKGEFATAEEREKRLAICRSCEYLEKSKNSIMRADRCKLCGCFVHIKAGYTNASCDIQKW